MLWLNFVLACFDLHFPLFLGMIIYDNEFETKENKIWTRDKIEPQHIQCACHSNNEKLFAALKYM